MSDTVLYFNQPLILNVAFSEMVPVLHIVGVPSTAESKTRPLLHHTLGDGRYCVTLRQVDLVSYRCTDLMRT